MREIPSLSVPTNPSRPNQHFATSKKWAQINGKSAALAGLGPNLGFVT